jgi:hypothetical protein
MSIIAVLKQSLNSIDPFRKQDPTTRSLNIKGKRGDTASQTHAKMQGGWLVDLGAYPESRQIVEDWMCEAMDKGFEFSTTDEKESRLWYQIGHELAVVMSVTRRMAKSRQAEADRVAAQMDQPGTIQ